eukprot:TRINITY_DN17570_c0_g1_i1.p1 TRINITY_DN17570_c0_g1~~TRINITY_DN17570_c0_g1_i1.p1  ORF type:complete len:503 (-),score=199.45 TRINITY_DN17570_c0_g1_i1:72-1505(-)
MESKAIDGGHRAASDKIVAATRRLSLSKMVTSNKKLDTEADKAPAEITARASRRRSSIMRMGVTDSVRAVVMTALNTAEGEGQLTGTPLEKLQALLTAAKERGMSAERLFEFFAPAGSPTMTADDFERALRELSPQHFPLSAAELDELMAHFDANRNGRIELSEFMEFCMAIPSLAWKAERARRMSAVDGPEALAEAARNSERRRSTCKAVDLGEKIHDRKMFFWRSQQNLDVVLHENIGEGVVIISTRSFDRDLTFPPIFVEASRIPIARTQINKAVDDKIAKRQEGSRQEPISTQERAELYEATRKELISEYLLNRLKVPDDANKPPGLSAAAKSPKRSTSPKSVAAAAMAAEAPFLQRLSTDGAGSVLCTRGLMVSKPYRFPAARRGSVDDFRRASLELQRLVGETSGLIDVAEAKAEEAGRTVTRARRLSTDMKLPSSHSNAWNDDYGADNGGSGSDSDEASYEDEGKDAKEG